MKRSTLCSYGNKHVPVLLAFLLLNLFALSQDRPITGKVTATTNGTPLPGVTVRVKDKQTTTTTDDQGSFTINASRGVSLVFTSVGYASQEVIVGDGSNVDVTMAASNNGLVEVIVVGYG